MTVSCILNGATKVWGNHLRKCIVSPYFSVYSHLLISPGSLWRSAYSLCALLPVMTVVPVSVIQPHVTDRKFQLREPVFGVHLWIWFEADALYPQLIDTKQNERRHNKMAFQDELLDEACDLANMWGEVELCRHWSWPSVLRLGGSKLWPIFFLNCFQSTLLYCSTGYQSSSHEHNYIAQDQCKYTDT